MELHRLKRQRASDEVYLALRQGILTHLFKPGERLLIEDIAGKLGVSLTPVRHAVQQLAIEGLVEIRPRSGTFVARLSADDIEETCQIRCALECLAGELAAPRINDAVITRFRAILRVLAEPVAGEEGRKRHEEANQRLHALLIEVSGNRKLAEIYESLRAHLQIARIHQAERDWESRLDQERAEHEEIVNALAARDTAWVSAALRRHIRRAKDAMLQSLKQTTE